MKTIHWESQVHTYDQVDSCLPKLLSLSAVHWIYLNLYSYHTSQPVPLPIRSLTCIHRKCNNFSTWAHTQSTKKTRLAFHCLGGLGGSVTNVNGCSLVCMCACMWVGWGWGEVQLISTQSFSFVTKRRSNMQTGRVGAMAERVRVWRQGAVRGALWWVSNL